MLLIIGKIITSGLHRSSPASQVLIQALCKAGKLFQAVRYLTRMRLEHNVETYAMVISYFREKRFAEDGYGSLLHLIKRGIDPAIHMGDPYYRKAKLSHSDLLSPLLSGGKVTDFYKIMFD
ncbi:hypothetical protein Godav_022270 [Gossypium davidsonii]|uniref:Pentatricopeptide repeat-containing protein n=1 Tax=Gossypium davidsonii TaxID=34287 RepID=A0A7J8T707_GOSDV|nr:hypothetical protein [Gossypium davidsonii]